MFSSWVAIFNVPECISFYSFNFPIFSSAAVAEWYRYRTVACFVTAQADLLRSTSPIAAISESEPVNPLYPTTSLPHPIFPLSHQTLVFNPLLPLRQYRILNKKQKPEQEKERRAA
ncbi:hypothetical protein TNCV_559021 [Trichonephila clavipes]|nr:hypothetical protein TNCV_559021 [Trichonephila clavipes]